MGSDFSYKKKGVALKRVITYFHLITLSSVQFGGHVYVCVCVCLIAFISIICVSLEEPSFIAYNQQIYDFNK